MPLGFWRPCDSATLQSSVADHVSFSPRSCLSVTDKSEAAVPFPAIRNGSVPIRPAAHLAIAPAARCREPPDGCPRLTQRIQETGESIAWASPGQHSKSARHRGKLAEGGYIISRSGRTLTSSAVTAASPATSTGIRKIFFPGAET